jgi:hypothetical protein
LIVALDAPISPEEVAAWIAQQNIGILNVASQRERYRSGFVYKAAWNSLSAVFRTAAQH